jgi:molecular chaperone DnaK
VPERFDINVLTTTPDPDGESQEGTGIRRETAPVDPVTFNRRRPVVEDKMASDKILGIDLGTTNSAFAVMEGEDPEIIVNATVGGSVRR